MRNKSQKRTKEEVDNFYKEYLEGSTLDEVSAKYSTDAFYNFKKYNLPRRTSKKTTELREKLNITNFQNNYKYRFEKISNEQEAYIVGFWFADGWVSSSQAGIRLQYKDKKIIEEIKNYISDDVILQNDNKSYTFVISREEIINNLISLGCLRNKTYKKLSIPNMDESLLRHFIRGYFDGDGTVYFDRNALKTNICSINKEFLKDIQNILTKNNIYSTINTEIREGKTYKTPQGTSDNCKNMHRLFIRRKEDFKKFYDFMYKDSTMFLERKNLKFNNGNTVLTQPLIKLSSVERS